MERKLNKRTLVFDLYLNGHHIEYLNHLYLYASTKTNENFIFAVPETFKDLAYLREWPKFKNINLHYIHLNDIKKCEGNLISSSYHSSKLLTKVSCELEVSHILLISLIRFIPFLPLFLSRSIKVSGIIYIIYLYRWKTFSFFQKLINILKYLILSKSKIFENVFILNDNASTRILNRLYNSNKFKYLPDPFVPIANSPDDNFRKLNNIPEQATVLFHFGDLSERKGTLDILHMVKYLNKYNLKNYIIIFAGKVNQDIRSKFYDLVNELKNDIKIIIFDEFCSFELLASLCQASSYILLPYKMTYLSSGLLGYSAQFKKPLVGPDDGLIGKLIRKYKLGYTLTEISAKSLGDFFNHNESIVPVKISNDYLLENSVNRFSQIILN